MLNERSMLLQTSSQVQGADFELLNAKALTGLINRRQHRRVEVNSKVTLRSTAGSQAGCARDVSLGGALLELESGGVTMTGIVALEFSLPGGTVYVPAEVVGAIWTASGVTLRLRFRKLSQHAVNALGALLAKQAVEV